MSRASVWLSNSLEVVPGRRQPPSGRWHLDEMVVNIRGKRMYLWRAASAQRFPTTHAAIYSTFDPEHLVSRKTLRTFRADAHAAWAAATAFH